MEFQVIFKGDCDFTDIPPSRPFSPDKKVIDNTATLKYSRSPGVPRRPTAISSSPADTTIPLHVLFLWRTSAIAQ